MEHFIVKYCKADANTWIAIHVKAYGCRSVKIEKRGDRYTVWDSDNVNPDQYIDGYDKLKDAKSWAHEYLYFTR